MSDALWTLLPIVAVVGTVWAVGRARNLPLPTIPPPDPPSRDEELRPRRVIPDRYGGKLTEPTAEEMYRYRYDQWNLLHNPPGRYVDHIEHRRFIDEHCEAMRYARAEEEARRRAEERAARIGNPLFRSHNLR